MDFPFAPHPPSGQAPSLTLPVWGRELGVRPRVGTWALPRDARCVAEAASGNAFGSRALFEEWECVEESDLGRLPAAARLTELLFR